MADVNLYHLNQTYVGINTDPSRMMELKKHLSFRPKGYQFNPKFKAGYWDGYISLINVKERKVLKGLVGEINQFCEDHNYSISIDPEILEFNNTYNIDEEKTNEFYKRIKAPYELHDSQTDAFIHCVNNNRALILAPTSNGKSYIMHGLAAFHALQRQKVLIVIHRSQLILQLTNNLRDEYLGKHFMKIGNVYDDDPKNCDVFITTWQSCYKQPARWFEQFDVLIADEVHTFKAPCLNTIIDNSESIETRYGFTATLDNDSISDRLTLIGMFGPPHRVATTKQLIDAGIIAKPTVYAIIRIYSDQLKKEIRDKYGTQIPNSKSKKLEFVEEYTFLESSEERNKFIAKLEHTLKGNTLVAFKREQHGKNIVDAINQLNPDKDVYFINFRVDKQKRVEYSDTIDQMKDATAVVSIGTFSTGVNIKNVNNIINACQIKSKITVPQLIGRGLRLSDRKDTVDIYDIGDDLTINGKQNATYTHFLERLQLYASEGFDIKIKKYYVR